MQIQKKKQTNNLLRVNYSATVNYWLLTAKGSACSQDMGAPQVLSLILSGRDSGTASRMKQMSARAINVATRTTRLSPYQADRYAPMAGLVTRLAAKVADT